MAANPSPLVSSRRARRRVGALALAAAVLAASAVVLLPSSPVGASSLPVATRLVSRDNAGAVMKGAATSGDIAISGNGRFVAFVTAAPVVGSDTNGAQDVYVRDLWAATTELVSLTDDEKPIAGDSVMPSLSDDGRFVSFLTDAPNLIPNDDKGHADAFVRDRYEGTTRRVAPGLAGALLSAPITQASLSGNGRYVTFSTSANNVVASDSNGDVDIFVRDLFGSDVERVSLTALDGQSNANSSNSSLSDDGRYVVFDSQALLAGGVVGTTNVYLRDRTAGTTQLVNLTDGDSVPNGYGASPAISGNGQVVAFASDATDLVAGDTNGGTDIFVRNLTAGTTTRVSLSDADAQLPLGGSSVPYGISDDGLVVLFSSLSPATTATDAGGDYDVYRRDTVANTTRRITTGPALADPASNRLFAAIDDAGQSVAFPHNLKITTDASFDQVYVNGPVEVGPFGGASGVIAQQYTDFLNRAFTASEMTTWTNRFNLGSASPATLIAQLSADPAWSAKRAPLIRLYWAFFLRRPDPSGLTYWLGKYQAGQSLTKIAQSFAASSEFKNRYGPVTNRNYVKLVYQNVFERAPDSGGLNFWTGKLDRKEITRGGVIVQFSESSEGKRRLAGPTNITLISLAMLRSVPSVALWNELYPTIDLGEPQSAAFVAQKILVSLAYESRFD